MAKSRYRKHGALPAYFQWRDGRPCWNPAGKLRDAGWKRCDLKDPQGRYLTQGAAIDQATVINTAVAAWKDGQPVPAAFAAFAPQGSSGPAPVFRHPEDALSIGALWDAWLASDEFDGKSPATQRDYANKLRRLMELLAGYAEPPRRIPTDRHAIAKVQDMPAAIAARQVYDQAIADLRGETIFSLEPAADAGGVLQDPLYDAYQALKRVSGVRQSAAVMTVASVWLNWCRKRRSRAIQNWAAEVEKETAEGRIRVWTVSEFRIMVETAEALGQVQIADAMVLGLDLSWSQVDRLQLTWARITEDQAGVVRALTRSQHTEGGVRRETSRRQKGQFGRAKTGRVGGTPLTRLGRARLVQIQARQDQMEVKPTHVITRPDGQPWDGSAYRKAFAQIRAVAAERCPSLLDREQPDGSTLLGVTDADLRDTAWTWMKQAGLSDDGIASRTLQGRRHIADLGDRGYGEIGPETADPAAALYDAHLVKLGVAV